MCLSLGNRRISSWDEAPAYAGVRMRVVVDGAVRLTPRVRISASQTKGGRHGDRVCMTATAVVAFYPSHLPAPDGMESRDLSRRPRSNHRPMLAPWQVSLAQSFMIKHLSEPLHLPELARMCRLSPTYFVRAFANTVGMAPYAWFVDRRVAQAQILLADSKLPLAQIALDCGFSDQAHFTKAFGKATGTTPARWRRGQSHSLSERRRAASA